MVSWRKMWAKIDQSISVVRRALLPVEIAGPVTTTTGRSARPTSLRVTSCPILSAGCRLEARRACASVSATRNGATLRIGIIVKVSESKRQESVSREARLGRTGRRFRRTGKYCQSVALRLADSGYCRQYRPRLPGRTLRLQGCLPTTFAFLTEALLEVRSQGGKQSGSGPKRGRPG